MQLGYNIVWDGFTDHVQGMLRDLNEFDYFTDVTIVCDDQKMLKAHRFILSASSDVFRTMLNGNSNPHAFIYLRGIQHKEMELILKYIYSGQVTFENEMFRDFLNVAKDLKIKELNLENEYLNQSLKGDDENSPHTKPEQVEYDTKNVSTSDKMPSNTSVNGDPEPLFNPNNPKIPKVQCPDCNKILSTKKRLKVHIQSKHEGMRWPCNQCDFKAWERCTLNSHYRTVHQFDQPIKFKCVNCDYETLHKGDLNVHTKKHHTTQ